jgi:hypothetical protein
VNTPAPPPAGRRMAGTAPGRWPGAPPEHEPVGAGGPTSGSGRGTSGSACGSSRRPRACRVGHATPTASRPARCPPASRTGRRRRAARAAAAADRHPVAADPGRGCGRGPGTAARAGRAGPAAAPPRRPASAARITAANAASTARCRTRRCCSSARRAGRHRRSGPARPGSCSCGAAVASPSKPGTASHPAGCQVRDASTTWVSCHWVPVSGRPGRSWPATPDAWRAWLAPSAHPAAAASSATATAAARLRLPV